MIAFPMGMDYRYGMEKRIIRIPRRKREETLMFVSKPLAHVLSRVQEACSQTLA